MFTRYGKGVSVYKPLVVFAVIHETKKYSIFKKFHESQEKPHKVYKQIHLL